MKSEWILLKNEVMEYLDTFMIKFNVYFRVLGSKGKFKNNKIIGAFCTYTLSSIWHGFYSFYYVSFLMIYLFEQDGLFLKETGFYDFIYRNKIL